MGDEEQDDRRVARRSNDELRAIALRTKSYFRIGRTWPVNICRVLGSPKVLTLRGEKVLIYEVVDDHLLGDKDAKTELIEGKIKITAKRSVDVQATYGDGRSRMTLVHELGHAVMHASEGTVDHRATGAVGTTTVSKINASELAEHQAKVFASAFLIDDVGAAELATPLEIAEEFLVSLSAAEICYERLQEQAERAAAAQRVTKSNQEFQELMRLLAQSHKYLGVPCVSCRRSTLIPLGPKVFCVSCRYKGDHPQSGDPAGWPAPGSEDTELRCLMEQEAGHGEATVYAGVQG